MWISEWNGSPTYKIIYGSKHFCLILQKKNKKELKHNSYYGELSQRPRYFVACRKFAFICAIWVYLFLIEILI